MPVLMILLLSFLVGCGGFKAQTLGASESLSIDIPGKNEGASSAIKVLLSVQLDSTKFLISISDQSLINFQVPFDPSAPQPSCGVDCGKNLALWVFAPIRSAKLIDADDVVIGSDECPGDQDNNEIGCRIALGGPMKADLNRLVKSDLCGASDNTYRLVPGEYTLQLNYKDGSTKAMRFQAPNLCDERYFTSTQVVQKNRSVASLTTDHNSHTAETKYAWFIGALFVVLMIGLYRKYKFSFSKK